MHLPVMFLISASHRRRAKAWLWPLPWAWLFAWTAAGFAPEPNESQVPVATKAPPVVNVEQRLVLGRPVNLQVAGLKAWAEASNTNTPWKLLLYLDGRPSVGDYPQSVNVKNGALVYYLRITAEN